MKTYALVVPSTGYLASVLTANTANEAVKEFFKELTSDAPFGMYVYDVSAKEAVNVMDWAAKGSSASEFPLSHLTPDHIEA